jgi:catechol 2,3-dioxygenase-like lactoylglutathione lyase family enzyme
MKSAFLPLVFLSMGWPALAQLAPPNAAGVTLGQIHLIVKDVDAERRFFIDMMDGVPVENDKISMIQLPGVFVIISQGDPNGPSAGSTINHFGVVLKDVDAYRTKWEANHLVIDQAQNPKAGYVHSPSGLRIEFYEDPSLSTPLAMNHFHFFMAPERIPEMQAWYVKVFGAKPSQRYCTSCLTHKRLIETLDLPGTNFSLAPLSPTNSSGPPVPTKGRQIDHIGFEVTNLKVFVEKAEANGVKFDEPYRASKSSANVHIAYLTDPWGTRIELTEGLAP